MSEQTCCSCVRRMRLQFSATDRYDYAIVNAVEERLPDWLTSHLVQVVCTTCGEEFYAGKVGELLMSIHTSATEERDAARAEVVKWRGRLATAWKDANPTPAILEAVGDFLAYTEGYEAWR